MRSRLLALDAGSSSIKSVLFDDAGKPLCEESAHVPLMKKERGVVERDLAKVWKAVLETLSRMRVNARRDFDNIDALSVTGAGDGLILLDNSNTLVRPAITSLDTRATELIARFKKSSGAMDLYNLIGEIPYPATPLALLKWTKQNESASYRKARKVLFLKDWVRYKLTAEVCTDITDASATLTDFYGVYRKEIFDAFGVLESAYKTVEVKASHDLAGHITRHAASMTGLTAGIPVICGLHDCSASSLGAGCTRPGETCLIVGSWCGNQIVTDRPILNKIHPDHQILRNYAIPGNWLIISASPTALVNLEWFISTFMNANASVYARVDTIVNKTPNDESLIFHPYLYGSQTSEQASGGFYGIRPWHSLGHFLRSIYEGIAINYRIHGEHLAECLATKRVVACGGGTRSRVLVQLMADAINKKIRVSSLRQTTALGAAITAAVGIGIYRSFKEACREMTSIGDTFSPKTESAHLLSRKEIAFTNLYRQMASLWRETSA